MQSLPQALTIPASGIAGAMSQFGLKPLSERGKWTETQRSIVYAVYADTGNALEAAKVAGVPDSTARSWITADGAEEAINNLRVAIRSKVGFAYAACAIKATQLVMDVLERGEERLFGKDGNTVRVQPSLRDLTMTMAVFTDKHALITGMLERERATDKQLNSLAGELLARMGELAKPKASEPEPPVADAGSAYLG